MVNIFDELEWRGDVNQVSDEEGLSKLIEDNSEWINWWDDPNGDSLQIRHLSDFMQIKRFQ